MINPLKLIGNKGDSFNIWAFSDAHNGASVVDELSLACTQMDNEKWDIGFHLGDTINATLTSDAAFKSYKNQYNTLINHSLNQIYNLGGNHDVTVASSPFGADAFYKKYCSPFAGDNNYYNGQPYVPIGDYQSYYLEIGNMLIVMLGDDNSGSSEGGEDGTPESGTEGWRPSGNITQAQWNWFKNIIEANTDKIIIVGTHHGVKDTTIGTGWEEFNKAFSRDENFDPTGIYNVEDSKRMGYIAYIGNSEGEIDEVTGDSDATNEIKTWLETNGQYIDLWMHGHYHRKLNDEWNGRTRLSEKYGTTFINVSCMNSKIHLYYSGLLEQTSNMLQINRDKLLIKTYIHKDPNNNVQTGYYSAEDIEITLKRKFIK